MEALTELPVTMCSESESQTEISKASGHLRDESWTALMCNAQAGGDSVGKTCDLVRSLSLDLSLTGLIGAILEFMWSKLKPRVKF